MNDGWTEHRPAARFDTPSRFVVTGDTRSPEELAQRGTPRRTEPTQPIRAPIPPQHRKPWRPGSLPANRTMRPRPPHLLLRLVVIIGGPTLIITAALATGRSHPSLPAPPPAAPRPAITG